MILSKLWERKLFTNILKLTLFFLFAIFLIVIVIDFSIHGAKIFSHSKTSFSIIVQYYKNLLLIQLNLLLSLTFMLATIKILSDMNIHNEITAFRMATISAKEISRPFFLIALIFVAISYLNFQFFYPDALNYKDNFKDNFLKKTTYKKKMQPNVLHLKDNTKIVYQKYNIKKKELFDVYIIKSSSDIWHAKYLYLDSLNTYGKYVDHLVQRENSFEKEKSYLTYNFKNIEFDNKNVSFVPPENRSISTLYKQSYANSNSKEKNELTANLHYKLAIPLASILIVLSLFPYLIHFSKNISIFFISSFAIFGFVIFYTAMDAALILAENSTIPPYLIIWFPIIIILTTFGKKYSKT